MLTVAQSRRVLDNLHQRFTQIQAELRPQRAKLLELLKELNLADAHAAWALARRSSMYNASNTAFIVPADQAPSELTFAALNAVLPEEEQYESNNTLTGWRLLFKHDVESNDSITINAFAYGKSADVAVNSLLTNNGLWESIESRTLRRQYLPLGDNDGVKLVDNIRREYGVAVDSKRILKLVRRHVYGYEVDADAEEIDNESYRVVQFMYSLALHATREMKRIEIMAKVYGKLIDFLAQQIVAKVQEFNEKSAETDSEILDYAEVGHTIEVLVADVTLTKRTIVA